MRTESSCWKFNLGAWILILVLALIPACSSGGSSGGGGGGGGYDNFVFTSVPEVGSNDNLQGNAGPYNPDEHMVAVYIMVAGGWWTKPTFASPLTSIRSDGSWTCDITTGGNDAYATDIAAFLLPIGVDPPKSSGSTLFPVIPEAIEIITFDRMGPAREVFFEGLYWEVKQSDFRRGPGPNYFSDDPNDVWVDSKGLHLTITKKNGRWECTEVIAKETFGYGTYVVETMGRVDILDPWVVFGAFTWNTEDPYGNFTEIDAVEYARWGNPNEPTNGQFVVQPCSICPGSDNCSRFRVDLTDNDSDLTHYMVWSEGMVEFWVYYGHHIGGVPSDSDLIHHWTFIGDDVPWPSGENFRFNLWLVDGNPPSNGQNEEIVISGFRVWPE